MSKLTFDNDGDGITFYCPGCDSAHRIIVSNPSKRTNGWTYNGNADKPTFSPSVLVNSTKATKRGEEQYDAWVSAGYPKPAPDLDRMATVCHSFVTDGRIQFLDDCTHHLKSQTVDLPEQPEWMI
jgi:hypothetical protein